jgi:hypothetical protein
MRPPVRMTFRIASTARRDNTAKVSAACSAAAPTVSPAHTLRNKAATRLLTATTAVGHVVGRGHVSLLINLDNWHSKRVMDIADL